MAYTTLVSTQQLAARLDDPDWVILDSRHDLMNRAFGHEAYAGGHVPGARFISIDDDLADHAGKGRGRHPLPSPTALGAVFSRLGIDAGKQVVVYDSASGSSAARAWWCLRWLGHPNVAILDGGITQWKAEGRALATAMPAWQPASFQVRPDDNMKIETPAVLAQIDNTDSRVIDARAAERYDGSAETIDPVGGHIPGALNRFWKANLDADGKFKPATQLRAEFAALMGQLRPGQLIHQCGSGVTACHNLLAMEIAGLPGGKLYPGSWSEWCADATRPVATGRG
jgi:thiosulfate/3-mercaptopyruvate sulfurtransferase